MVKIVKQQSQWASSISQMMRMLLPSISIITYSVSEQILNMSVSSPSLPEFWADDLIAIFVAASRAANLTTYLFIYLLVLFTVAGQPSHCHLSSARFCCEATDRFTPSLYVHVCLH